MPVVVNHEELRELSQALYEAAGTPSDHATIVVNHQVGANLKGHDSHGVVLLPTYVNRIDRGHIMPTVKPEIISETPTTIQVNGQWGFGPVISEFEGEPDRWVKAGRLFSRPRMATGTQVDLAATNNLLLDLHQVKALGLEFDSRFGLSGGDDTMFTRELHRGGGVMVWSDEAIVIDVVPQHRSTMRWVMLRALRLGTTWSTVALALAESRSSRARLRVTLSGQGLLRVAGGCARALYGAVTRSVFHQARGLRIAARGSGMLLGAWGYEYQEYKRASSAHH